MLVDSYNASKLSNVCSSTWPYICSSIQRAAASKYIHIILQMTDQIHSLWFNSHQSPPGLTFVYTLKFISITNYERFMEQKSHFTGYIRGTFGLFSLQQHFLDVSKWIRYSQNRSPKTPTCCTLLNFLVLLTNKSHASTLGQVSSIF